MTDYYDQSYPPSLWAPAPPVVQVPTLASITPTTGVTATEVNLHAIGTNYDEDTVIRFDTTALETNLISSTECEATGTLPAPNTYSVTVRNSAGTSNGRGFIVTATADEEEGEVTFTAIPVPSADLASDES